MLEGSGTFSILDKIAVPRSIPLLLALALSACATAASMPPEKTFAPVDPSKFKDSSAQGLALQIAFNDCRAKALVAITSIEQNQTPKETIVTQTNVTVQNGAGNGTFLNGIQPYVPQPYVQQDWGSGMGLYRRNEIQSAIFVSCMNKAGFIQK